MGKRLVITEKPSVARDIAAALGGFEDSGDDYLESEDFVVTWALGHLLELAEPQDYDKTLRSWSIKNLPIIPDDFKIKPRDKQKKRIDLIKKLGKRKDIEGIINACDAGREGELIFRRIVEHTGLDAKPQERLWLQSMTQQAIRDAFKNLRPGSELDRLAHAARLRAIGDWLIGMNATRALTQRLKSRGERGSWSAGRVQTPTLNMLVQREREILAHVPRDYWELVATFRHDGEGGAQTWEGRFYDEALKKSEDRDIRPTRIFDRARVESLLQGLAQHPTGQASEVRKKSNQRPPLLFDLTALQREANRRYSISAKRTLEAAQRLYEGHKLLTYPRTDSRHLPEDYGPTVTKLLDWIASTPDEGPTRDLGALAQGIVQQGPQNLDKILDSSKVSDHFAIIPTGNAITRELTGDDARVFDLVMRQFLAALMGPAVWATVERFVDFDLGEAAPVRFRTTARSLEVPGFLAALGQEAGAGSQLPALVPGQDRVEGVEAIKEELREEAKETRPPGRYSEAQLLRMMETAGQYVEDEEYSEALRGSGLGTPATRADTIERLVHTSYARRAAGRLAPTSKGMRLIDVLQRVDAFGLASPQLTGQWFHQLNEVEQGRKNPSEVEKDLSQYTRDVVGSLIHFEHERLYEGLPSLGTCPECGGEVIESAWGYPCKNNSGADSPCNFIIWKDRAGRFINRELVPELLQMKEVGPLEGFVDRGGRQFMTGTLKLAKDPDKDRWVLDVDYKATEEGEEVPEEVAGDALWPCPVHEDCQIIETNLRYVCEKVLKGETRQGPVLPRLVCHREMSVDEIAPFFAEEGRTETMGGFISRRGRPFRGLLFRKPTGRHGFEFPPREPRKKKSDGDEAEAKKTAAKKSTAKKAPAKKAAAKKTTTAKKTTAAASSTTAAKKTTATKKATAAKKTTTAKKTTAAKKTTTAKKTTAATKTTAAKKAPAKKATAAKKAPAAKKTASTAKKAPPKPAAAEAAPTGGEGPA